MLDIKEYEAMMMFDLPDDERERLSIRLNTLERDFAALEQVDTADVAPLVTVLNMNNILREDISAKFISRDELLSNAPEQYDGYFKVPGTLE
jgi:aspartyl-tRNA(Asn)/glutamyl-tRNA(Gln) amidotransferase subunit C